MDWFVGKLFDEDDQSGLDIHTIIDCSCGTYFLLVAAVQMNCSYCSLDINPSCLIVVSKDHFSALMSLVQINCSSAMIDDYLKIQTGDCDSAKAHFYRNSRADSFSESQHLESTPSPKQMTSARTSPADFSQGSYSVKRTSMKDPDPKHYCKHKWFQFENLYI